MATKNKEIVNKVNEAFADNNVEGFLAQCANDIEWTMVGDRTVKGKDGIRQFMESMPAPAPTFTVSEVIAEGDFVMAHGEMKMDDNGQKDVPYSYCDIYHFRGGQIDQLRSFVIKTTGEPA
jgi:ketosteroid isomerase-like protein